MIGTHSSADANTAVGQVIWFVFVYRVSLTDPIFCTCTIFGSLTYSNKRVSGRANGLTTPDDPQRIIEEKDREISRLRRENERLERERDRLRRENERLNTEREAARRSLDWRRGRAPPTPR